jgi:hypothetical protein
LEGCCVKGGKFYKLIVARRIYLIAMGVSASFSYKDLLDMATRIAVQARIDKLAKDQIENLIGSLYAIDDPKDALLVAQLFAQRQAVRFGKRKGNVIVPCKAMSEVGETFDNMYNMGKDRVFAAQFLTLVKWIYESMESIERDELSRINVKTITFDELMKILRGR